MIVEMLFVWVFNNNYLVKIEETCYNLDIDVEREKEWKL